MPEAGRGERLDDRIERPCRPVLATGSCVIRAWPPTARRHDGHEPRTADLRHPDAAVPARDLAEQLETTSNTIYVARNKAHKKLARLLEARGHSFS